MSQGRADYAERREARIERLRARAERLRAEGRLSIASAQRIANMIPLGQPILIGHHSERRHRKDIARIDAGYVKGFEALNTAQTIEGRAHSAERNDTISSDDPEALVRLRAKKTKLEKFRDDAKIVNACVRKCKGDAAKLGELLKAKGLEFSATTCKGLLTPDFAGRIGIPSYELTNKGAEIRRIEQRIKALEAEAVRPDIPDQVIGCITLRESDNRVQLIFPGKPPEACRSALKAGGFKWSPPNGAWQRLANATARHVAERLAKEWSEVSL